jgi:hypothetical protein
MRDTVICRHSGIREEVTRQKKGRETMDYIKVVAELREYLADLDAAISSVRRLEDNCVRRGRRPALAAAKRSTRRRKVHSLPQSQTRH